METNPTYLANKHSVEVGKADYLTITEETTHPMDIAHQSLMKLLDDNKDTEYGKKYGFADIHSIEEYQKRVPVITYDNVAEELQRMLNGEKNVLTAYDVNHMNETSGTIGAMKIIPMTAQQAAMYQKYNLNYFYGIMGNNLNEDWMQHRVFCTSEGCHRTAPSGITVGCASSKMVDFIGGREKADAFMRITFTSPIDAAAPIPGTDSKYLHARFFLEEKNVGGIITGFFSLVSLYLKYISDNYKMLINDIRTGTIDPSISIAESARESVMMKIKPNPMRAAELEKIFENGSDIPFIPLVWPNMQFMYGVGGSTFASFDKTINERYGGQHLKRIYSGITASEGLFSIPSGIDNPDSIIAPGAGFIEFLPVDAKDDFSQIVTMDKLEEGKIYEIVYTNLAGLYRYRMSDAVKCTGFYNKTPLVQFMYRVNRTVNLVCEKTTEQAITLSVEKVASDLGIKLEAYNMYPNADVFPVRYDFLLETTDGIVPDIDNKTVSKALNDALCKYNAEYEDCANVDHTIGLPGVEWLEKNTNDKYVDLMAATGKSPSQIKPARVITNDLQKSFFYKMRKADMTKAQALQAIQREEPSIVGLSDAIFDHPECNLHETFASASICKYLSEQGFVVEEGAYGIPTAFTATYGKGSPRIGILAEYDALPVVGHACGHNLLAGGSIGAAIAIKEYLAAYPDRGTVVLYGCPDEEVTGTKTFMARDGAFNDLDLALCWHPADINIVPFGITSAVTDVQYTFRGKSEHFALADGDIRNALDGAELMNIGVKYLRSQYQNSVNIGYAYSNAGSDAPNIVQDIATTHFCIRTRKLKDMTFFVDRVNDVAKGASLMSATELTSRVVGACSGFVPNRELASVLYENFTHVGTPQYTDEELAQVAELQKDNTNTKRYLRELIGIVDNFSIRKSLTDSQTGNMFNGIIPPTNYEVYNPTSTDVGDVSRVCPVGQISVSTVPVATTAHSIQFAKMGKTSIAHKGMLTAAKVIAATAIDMMENPARVQLAKNDFTERTNGHPYRCPLPDDVTMPA